MPQSCPYCGSRHIRGLGMGTQRLESMVKKLWPEARVLRLDSDVARGPDAYFEIWETFRERRAHILGGPQLLTRGLGPPAGPGGGGGDPAPPPPLPGPPSPGDTVPA